MISIDPFKKMNCTLLIPANPQELSAYCDKTRNNLKNIDKQEAAVWAGYLLWEAEKEMGPNPWELNVFRHHIPEHKNTVISHWKSLWYQIVSYELSRIKYLWPALSPGRQAGEGRLPWHLWISSTAVTEPYLQIPIAQFRGET